MKKTDNYYPELDTLRFLAFLLVLIHHAHYVKTITAWRIVSEYGWMGVDLFLCLSAFLFTRLLFTEFKAMGNINIRNFYIRRAFRIWPLYLLFFGIMTALSIQEQGWDSSIARRALGMLTFTDNIFASTMGYNDVIFFSSHLWTISYEEQFYMVIPWVLRKFYQLRKSTTIIAVAIAVLVGSLIRAVLIYNKASHPVIWVLPISHFESIIGGKIIGLGLLDKYLEKIPSPLLLIGGVLALWQVCLLPNVIEIQWKLMITYPLLGLGMSLIIFAVMQKRIGFLSILFRNQMLGYLGKISYGLYVYHLMGLNIGYRITEMFIASNRPLAYPAAGILVGLFVTILVSTASYQLFEKPFLRIKERFALIESRPI